MAKQEINFTKATLQKIEAPLKPQGAKGGVYDTYHDIAEKGLTLIVSNGGAKTFYLYMKVNGTPRRIKLGAYPDLTIDQARKLAREQKGMIARGIDPVAVKKQKQLEGSLAAFFEMYLEQHAKKHNRAWKQAANNFRLYLIPLHHKALSNITTDMVRAQHNHIAKKNGIYAANRTLSLLQTMYNKAIEWGWQGSNPAQGIRKFKEKSRERFLQPDELPRFMEALEAEPNHDMRDYFKMLLLTGARRSNVASMHWRDISLELATWTIPDTKNGESYVVNLSELACKLLESRVYTNPKAATCGVLSNQKLDGWVFPSSTSASGHIEEPKSAWKRICQRAGIEDLRIHDLRRTLGSYQAITGANGYVIGKSLGHKSSAATEIYARLHADPVRESVERATKVMFGMGG